MEKELQAETDILADIEELRREQIKLKEVVAEIIVNKVRIAEENALQSEQQLGLQENLKHEMKKRVEDLTQSFDSFAVNLFNAGLKFNDRAAELLTTLQDMQIKYQDAGDFRSSTGTLITRIQQLLDESKATSSELEKFKGLMETPSEGNFIHDLSLEDANALIDG